MHNIGNLRETINVYGDCFYLLKEKTCNFFKCMLYYYWNYPNNPRKGEKEHEKTLTDRTLLFGTASSNAPNSFHGGNGR